MLGSDFLEILVGLVFLGGSLFLCLSGELFDFFVHGLVEGGESSI